MPFDADKSNGMAPIKTYFKNRLATLRVCLVTGIPSVFCCFMSNNIYAKFGAATCNVMETEKLYFIKKIDWQLTTVVLGNGDINSIFLLYRVMFMPILVPISIT